MYAIGIHHGTMNMINDTNVASWCGSTRIVPLLKDVNIGGTQMDVRGGLSQPCAQRTSHTITVPSVFCLTNGRQPDADDET
jgi:hypothetical protein